jgi:hypothetical protein
VRLISDAGKTPVERDALYNEIKVYGAEDIAAVMEERYRPVQRSRESRAPENRWRNLRRARTRDETEADRCRSGGVDRHRGLFVYLYNSIDSIVKNGIERYGTDVCGTKVSVGSVDISLKSGTGTIHDLRVANPDGFSHDSAVVLGGATLVLDIGSLNRDPLVIRRSG